MRAFVAEPASQQFGVPLAVLAEHREGAGTHVRGGGQFLEILGIDRLDPALVVVGTLGVAQRDTHGLIS